MADGAEYFENKASSDLGRLALRGGVISVAMQCTNGALQMVAAIILARLLAPAAPFVTEGADPADGG